MPKQARQPYAGPVLFSAGFRPLFLAATVFATGVVPLWMLVWAGDVSLNGPFTGPDWHIHEMLFGYPSAVIAGFLFTAVPNWTGRMPKRGWPLMVLTALWVIGRLAVAGALGFGPVAVMAVDCAFMLAIGGMITTEIVAGRNWGNLKVIGPVLMYLVANVTFHYEAMTLGSAEVGRRLGFAMVVLLILLIGGRIIPSFTRNWLVQRAPGPGALPSPFGRFDRATIAVVLVVMMAWVIAPQGRLVGFGLVAAGVLQAVRLGRWRGWRVWRSALLLMLHVAFAFLPAGLVALGLASFDVIPAVVGLHLLGIGGFGGMTVAVMMRASLGHTGRELAAGYALSAAFSCVVVAAVVRVTMPSVAGLWVAAGLWSLGFATIVLRLGPVLTQPRIAGRQPR